MRKLFLKFGIGSQSTDFPSLEPVDNPLPACPKSLNCIRITKLIEMPVDVSFDTSLSTVNSMKPADISISKENYRIDSEFKVFFFYDDMVLQITGNDSTSSHLHIRSASRIGFSDLGVNTRRVKRFLKRLAIELKR